MAQWLTPVSWGPNGDPDLDHDIQDGLNYEAQFRTRTGGDYVHAPRPVSAVRTERPGNSSVFAYAQPSARSLFLWIRLLPNTATVEVPVGEDVALALVDQLQSWFSEENGEQWLCCEDRNGNIRRIKCLRTTMEPDQDWLRWNIQLEATYGLFESVDEEGTEYEGIVLTEAEPTLQIEGKGSMPAYPTITLTPTAVKAAVESPRYRRRIVSVNRIDRNVDTPNVGYPVDITGGGLDLSALFDAGKLLNNLDDLRVIVAGQEKDRWPSTDTPAASTLVWGNWSWRPGKSAILQDAIDADDTVFRTNQFNGFAGWEPFGAAMIDNEAVLYQRDATDIYRITITRGAMNTTAASHSANAVLRWIEHPFADLLYGFSNAGAAPAPLYRKPIFSLVLSTNLVWDWTGGPHFNADDLRTGAWFRMYTNDNPGSPFFRTYESNGVVYIQNATPEAGKPRANNLYIDVPCGLRMTGGPGIQINVQFGSVSIPVEAMGWLKSIVTTNYEFDKVRGNLNIIQYDPVGPSEIATYEWYNYDIIDVGSSETESTRFVTDAERGPDRVSLGHQKFHVGEDVQILTPSGPAADSGQTLRSTPVYERVVKRQVETTYTRQKGILPQKQRILGRFYITDRESYESYLTGGHDQVLNRDVFRVRLNAQMPIGVDEDGVEWDTIPDGAKNTGGSFRFEGIKLYMNPSTVPLFQLSPEEEVYVIDGRLSNDTTGEYIDILHPCAIGQHITIDTKNHRLIDSETGWEVPHAVRGGSWPRIKEGVVNTWRWTEADASMQVDFSWRREYN